jgi:hypothetical protein
MTPPRRSYSAFFVFSSCLAALAFAACAASEPAGDETGTAGTSGGSAGTTGGGSTGGTGPGTAGTVGNGGSIGSGEGGSTGSAGVSGSAGSGPAGASGEAGHGGTTGTAGTTGAAGRGGTSGTAGTTGAAGRGGTTGTAGTTGLAGRGGTTGTAGTTGAAGRGGTTGTAGVTGTAGATGTAGTTGGGGSVAIDCNATLPSGGTAHTSSNASGTAAGMNWTIWTNSSPGTITTFSVPAFSASWNNSGDYLARLGLQWNATKTYDALGTVTAQYASKKTGSGGGYSYIGMYGWSVSPCVEFYIVDDSFNKMPVNPGNTTNKGTVTIDGGQYILYTRNTSGTGGSKCPGVSNWVQFYSVRMTARTCGQISVTEHFKAWAAAGMTLGKMDQAQLLVEVGGGQGSVDFPVANMTLQAP